MIHSTSAVLQNGEQQQGYTGHIADHKSFCIVEITDQYTEEDGLSVMAHLKSVLFHAHDLYTLDASLKQLIREGALPASISLAVGFVLHNTINLKTYGQGQVWLRRSTNFINLIKGDHSASGPVNSGDTLLFTTESFISSIESTALVSFMDQTSLPKAIEDLNAFMKSTNLLGGIALITRFTVTGHVVHTPPPLQEPVQTAIPQSQQQIQNPTPSMESEQPTVTEKKKWFPKPDMSRFRALLETNKKKKIITFALVFVIIIILIWSVGFGYQRRQTAQTLAKINQTKEVVTQKLNQSDEVSFLNPQRSLILINEAHSELETLKRDIGPGYELQIGELETMIKSREDQITHKENKTGEEFYNLTLDTKNASGSKFSLDSDNVSIVDSKNGTIYLLSLSKKSLDKVQSKEVQSSTSVLRYQDSTFFFVPSKGVFQIDSAGKAENVIEQDPEWGTIVDMQVYNGNLYLLDSQKEDIYKYIPTENGYSEKSSYIVSTQDSVQGGDSLAIDSSVYVSLDDSILKFTAGVQDEFVTVFPDEAVAIKKVIATQDSEKVFTWDKEHGVIYILGKNGTYERQVKSSTFAQADVLIVFVNIAYALQKEKIYKISIQ